VRANVRDDRFDFGREASARDLLRVDVGFLDSMTVG
jgi:hypothetical protein